MDKKRRYASAQFGADTPSDGEKPKSEIPRGLEVLVKKAAVDPEFEKSLIADPLAAAAEIELALDPTEEMMLRAVSEPQLRAIIQATDVPDSHRRTFLGRSATAMLIVLGAPIASAACMLTAECGGSPPEMPFPEDLHPYKPDRYLKGTKYTIAAVQNALSASMLLKISDIPESPFADTSFGSYAQERFSFFLANDHRIKVWVPLSQLKRWRTADDAVSYIDRVRRCQRPIIVLAAKLANVLPAGSLSEKKLQEDLKFDDMKRAKLCRAIASTLRIYVPWETFKNLRTVDDAVVYVGSLMQQNDGKRESSTEVASRTKPDIMPRSFGIRPDVGPAAE